MLANNLDVYVAVERMADIHRDVAEARLKTSLQEKQANTETTSAETVELAIADARLVADELMYRSAA